MNDSSKSVSKKKSSLILSSVQLSASFQVMAFGDTAGLIQQSSVGFSLLYVGAWQLVIVSTVGWLISLVALLMANDAIRMIRERAPPAAKEKGQAVLYYPPRPERVVSQEVKASSASKKEKEANKDIMTIQADIEQMKASLDTLEHSVERSSYFQDMNQEDRRNATKDNLLELASELAKNERILVELKTYSTRSTSETPLSRTRSKKKKKRSIKAIRSELPQFIV